MQALVYHGPGEKEWESKSDPTIEQPTDAIVEIDTTTICGTDLHILKGDVPTVTDGRTLGHEAVGTVVETGSGVEDIQQGDKVLVSCISACGRCKYCRRGLQSQCLSGGGWILGPWWMERRRSTSERRLLIPASTRCPRVSLMSRCCF